MKNLYSILELSKDAPFDEITKNYKFFIQAWHPDKFSDPEMKELATEKSKEINEAYQILSNFEKRKQYDISLGIYRSYEKGHAVSPSGQEVPIKQRVETYNRNKTSDVNSERKTATKSITKVNVSGIAKILIFFGGGVGLVSGLASSDSDANLMVRFINGIVYASILVALMTVASFIENVKNFVGIPNREQRIVLLFLVGDWIVTAGFGAMTKNWLLGCFVGSIIGWIISLFLPRFTKNE